MPPTPISIRPAFAADVPLILSFIREIADYEKLADQVVATQEHLRASLFPAPPARPVAEVLFGLVDSAPQGYAVFFHNFSTFMGRPGIYLEDIYVRPDFRGIGLGKALFKAVAALAVERACTRMEWAVLDWNTPAIEFYGALGARPMSDWTLFRLDGEALQAAGGR